MKQKTLSKTEISSPEKRNIIIIISISIAFKKANKKKEKQISQPLVANATY